LYFIPNKGQVNPEARFYAKTSHYTLWMTKQGLVFDAETFHSQLPARDVSRMIFLNPDKNPQILPVGMTKHRVNYFLGSAPSRWKTNITTSKAVLYKNLYKNIDLKVYGNEKQVEYDWRVKPGGKPGEIKIEYKNVKDSRIDSRGDLLIEKTFGKMVHKKPVGYQIIKGNKVNVDASFKKVRANTYGFKINRYDKRHELIIDPVVLVYSTYLGGNKHESCSSIAVDSNGNAYMTGSTESTDFPTRNPYRETYNGGSIITFVTKLSRQGDELLYSTYLGGKDHDIGHGIAVDGNGNAYVTGQTGSSDFPVINSFQETRGGTYDAFVAKLSPTGGELLYSTYLGGTSGDYGYDIEVDIDGNAYITGDTSSNNFPMVNPARWAFSGGYFDAFVAKLSPTGSDLLYSTYLGGKGADYSRGIAVDTGGNSYVAGQTSSTDFPIANAFQETFAGGYSDAFAAKLSPEGSRFLFSTYLGGNANDNAKAIGLDSDGNAYITGVTRSTDFPLVTPWQTDQPYEDIFVTKLSADGSSLLYSTYLGGSGYDYAMGIAVDSSGNAYITGETSSTDFPTHDPYQTNRDQSDAFVTKLSSSGSSILYSTYLGGAKYEYGRGITVDSNGDAYITGFTSSSDYPTQNPFQETLGGTHNSDGFVTKISHANPSPFIITYPYFGSVVNGTIDIEAKAIDNYPVNRMNFYIDGELKWVDDSPPFKCTWDTTACKSGLHTIGVVSFDPSNREFAKEITVVIDQLPSVTITNPLDGAYVHGTVDIRGTASDDIHTPITYLYIDGQLTESFISSTYHYAWDTYFSRPYQIKVTARDSLSQTASVEITVTVQNLILTLDASRNEAINAWIIKKDYGQLNLEVEKITAVPVERYVIYRKDAGGRYYLVKEIPASEFQGACSFNDFFLERDKTYTYKAEAIDPDNYVIAASNQITI
jgi:hypothetical protein